MRRVHNIQRRHDSRYLSVHAQARIDVRNARVGLNRTLPDFEHRSARPNVSKSTACSAALAKLKVARLRGQSPTMKNINRMAITPNGGLRITVLQIGARFNALQSQDEHTYV